MNFLGGGEGVQICICCHDTGCFLSPHPRKELGSLRLKVQCHEEKILESRFYAPFVQLMLKAVDDPMVTAAALVSCCTSVYDLQCA